MKDAIRQVDDGIILDLEISAGARKTSVNGYNPWRRRIEVRLSERAEKGKANDQLIAFFSELFGINSNNIRIIKGLTSSRKSVKVLHAKAGDALKILTQK